MRRSVIAKGKAICGKSRSSMKPCVRQWLAVSLATNIQVLRSIRVTNAGAAPAQGKEFWLCGLWIIAERNPPASGVAR